MKRALIAVFGLGSYLIFFATFLYALGFVGGFGVPKAIDSPGDGNLLAALAVDVLLLGVFAVQHSVMARPAFKRRWTQVIPAAAERSAYTLASSVALLLVFAFWRPIGGVVWTIDSPAGRAVAWGVFAAGWLTVLTTTFAIDHFELFGLRQTFRYVRGIEHVPPRFVTPGLYRLVRHPLYVGWLLAFWATPTMTVTHLVFALVTTGYILVAIRFEERDLLVVHGEDYASYRRQVPMLWPRFRARSPSQTPLPVASGVRASRGIQASPAATAGSGAVG